MADFEKRDGGYSVKKSEIVNYPKLNTLNNSSNELSDYVMTCYNDLKKNNITINDPKDIIIRKYSEYLAVMAIREKKKADKAVKTQNLLNRFKKIL